MGSWGWRRPWRNSPETTTWNGIVNIKNIRTALEIGHTHSCQQKVSHHKVIHHKVFQHKVIPQKRPLTSNIFLVISNLPSSHASHNDMRLFRVRWSGATSAGRFMLASLPCFNRRFSASYRTNKRTWRTEKNKIQQRRNQGLSVDGVKSLRGVRLQ